MLRLLAGTAKTGRLVVDGDHGSGEVWLREGSLVGGTVSTSPHAADAADLVFELLRFDGGSFAFDDGEQLVDGTEPAGVEAAIAGAEQLVADWAEVEPFVPSMWSTVTLAPEIGADVTVSPKQWKLLASLGTGATVGQLGDAMELTDLAASRRVKALVELGLVEVGEAQEAPAADPAPVEAASPEPAGAPAEDEGHQAPSVHDAYARDLALLSAEDGPVVLESSDDALLPEPLPGEGTSFVGDLGSLGTVDGRTFEAIEAEAAAAAPALGEAEVHDAGSWSSYGSFGEPEAVPAPEAAGSWADAGAGWSEPAPTWGEPAEQAEAPFAAADAAPAEADASGAEAADGDDRGSLLKFLSSVKP
ncbi:DUF4388 domain-containing protein [Aquihabitans sp. G128]|uniref:DUF4388 domain-containing protein n=1 Tax=Aquihabitans sp. G128 TaxID=2849779 RepID=UPI001C23BC17|nr:DUF4388 domain-containing protein [Aquihabitans sp. G128]